MIRIIALLLLLVSACTMKDDGFTDSIKFTDEYVQVTFIEELKRREVPFKLDGDGNVLYRPKHQSLVDEISKLALNKAFSNAMHFSSREYEELVKTALDAKDISFNLELRSDGRWLRWNEADQKKVEETLDNIQKTYQRVIE